MKNSLRRFVAFLVPALLLFTAASVFAQDLDDVTIAGRITDSNGLAVVGATVTVSDQGSGSERTVTTNEDGRYRLIELKPSVYKVRASATGFGAKERINLETVAGQNLQLDFNLSPADIQAEATVTVGDDDAPLVDTTRTIVGSTISEREIEEIPNSSRNPLDLVLTLGGTSEEQLSTRDLAEDRGQRGLSAPGTTPEEAGIFGLSGGAAYSNNITIDGLDNNDDRGASFRFQPSIEAISEVQVITNQFSAEYGRASGGRINLRTRGGGNKFRGRAFYFFRDDALNANTWNNNRNDIDRPPLRNHNPGFTFGGPIVKNKLFFFTSYEYDNLADTTVLDAWVPLNFSNPNFALPEPTDPGSTFKVTQNVGTPPVAHAVTVARYIVPTDTPAVKHYFTGRADWNINAAQNFIFSYQLGRSNDLRSFSGTNRIADSLIGRIRNTDAFNATLNYVITPNVVNQFRLQYSTLKPSSAQDAGALTPAVLVTFTGPTGQGGTQVFGSSTNSSDRAENRWQIQDTLTFVSGNHTFRFGGDVHKINTTYTDRFDVTGTYTFSNFYWFSINSPTRYQQNFNTSSELKNTYMGFFGQGDWRARSNLTISYGLRYERETVIEDNNNWGPRFAVAWNPFPKGNKTVIRFGAGIFYNRVLLRTVDDYTADSATLRFDTGNIAGRDQQTISNFLAANFPSPLTLDTTIPINGTQSFTIRELAQPSSVFRSLSPDLVIPKSYQLNLGFERELNRAFVFEVNLTYNKTTDLWRETNPNAARLPEGTPDRNGDDQITFTDHLLGIRDGQIRFYEGSYSDLVGMHTTESDAGNACPGGLGSVCWVNVNTGRNPGNCTNNTATAFTNSPTCRALFMLNNLRPLFNEVGPIQLEEVGSHGNSEYLGAIFELRSRYRRLKNGFGGSMRAVYTLSKLMDDGIVNTSDPTWPGDFSHDWSRSLANRRHRIALSGTFDTPNWLGKLRFSPLIRYGSSAPFNLSAGGIDRNLDDLSNDRPNYTGDVDDLNWRVFQTGPFPVAVASQLSMAPIGSPGSLPRNAGKGPSQFIFDLNIGREFRFGDRFRFRPVVEFNNVLNARVFSFGSNFINLENLTTQEGQDGFLAPTRTVAPRRVRVGFRFDF